MRRRPTPFSTADLSVALPRESVPVLAARHLYSRIEEGLWPKYLPGEHELCRLLNISRNSLRSALQILSERGVLNIRRGHQTEIIQNHSQRQAKRERVVHLLTPLEIHELGPFMHEWSLRLRQALAMKGIPLEIHTRRQLFQRHSARDLKNYIDAHAEGLWLLQIAPLKMQTWFMKTGTPCLLAGSPYPGITLPFVDVHARAAGRHAAGLLFSGGHRSIGVVTSIQRYAGDNEATEGIRESAAARSDKASIQIEEIKFSSEPDSLLQKIGDAMKGKRPPTALVLCHQWGVCGVISALHRLRIRVPEEISLICLQSGSFMDYITPTLAHYRANPQSFSRKLFQQIRQNFENARSGTQSPWLIPTFVPGKSVAPPKCSV